MKTSREKLALLQLWFRCRQWFLDLPRRTQTPLEGSAVARNILHVVLCITPLCLQPTPDSAGCMQVLRRGTSFSQRGNQIPRPVFFLVGEGVTVGFPSSRDRALDSSLSLPILRVCPAHPGWASSVLWLTSLPHQDLPGPPVPVSERTFTSYHPLPCLLFSSYLRRPGLSLGTQCEAAVSGNRPFDDIA